MGIKYNEVTKFYEVSYSKRHPVTGVPYPMKRKNIKSKVEANSVYRELIIAIDNKLKAKIVPSWAKVLDLYFESIRLESLTEKTIYTRDKVLRKHTLDVWGPKLIDEITTQEILATLNKNFHDKAESHKKYFIKCIRSVFQYSLNQGFINRNPTPLLKFKTNDKIKSVLGEEQIVKLLQKAQEVDWEWYPHYAMAVYTGMRNGELYALTWDKVDLDKRLIRVDLSWSDKNGYKSTKSGDDRILEIPMPLITMLQELKLQSAGNEFVLPRILRWDKGDQARYLRLFLQSIGLPQIRFHDLRASWATLLLGKGVAPSKVMAQGGWKDMDTMMIYMRKAGIDIKGSTSVLDGMSTHGLRQAEVLNFKTT
ncbi:MAG: site-specific integrase [Bdellovibrionaceae bacterium]|nr:site-specific integrase [Pseudobdellovibrionaceae bacterium]